MTLSGIVVGVFLLAGVGLSSEGNPPPPPPLCSPCIYVANQGSDEVTVIDGVTRTPILNIPAGKTPQFLAAHPNGERVYVSTHGEGNLGLVMVIDTTTFKVVTSIDVGKNPTGLAVNAVLSELYVLNSGDGTMSIINTATNLVTSTMPVIVPPYDVVVSADGTRFYVSSQSGGAVQKFDAMSKALLGSVAAGTPAGLVLNADGSQLYVADRAGNQVAIIGTNTLTNVGNIPAGVGVIALALNPAGDALYSANFTTQGTTISVMNPITKMNLGTLPVGRSPHALAIDPKDGLLYVSNTRTADVSVLNPQLKSLVATLLVGASPLALAIVYPPATTLDVCRGPILAGTPYDMNDPQWLVGELEFQNKAICAYRFFADLHMLGYNTEPVVGLPLVAHLKALHTFQSQHGLPVSDLVTKEVLASLDPLLAERQAMIAPLAKTFPMYDRMQPPHPNDVSRDWIAYIFQLPMTVLPASLRMGADETVQCIWGQCLAFVVTPIGADAPCAQLGCQSPDLTQPYRFLDRHFDAVPAKWRPWATSASELVETVLHEYAHHLDGNFFPKKLPLAPHAKSIDTTGFYSLHYDMSKKDGHCAPRLTNDPQAWITYYANQFNASCPDPPMTYFVDDFAESFSMYVQDGQGYRTAAQQQPTIAKTYAWLKTNVFEGIEYDTHMQRGVQSGCQDVKGLEVKAPGYAFCSTEFVWDGLLKIK